MDPWLGRVGLLANRMGGWVFLAAPVVVIGIAFLYWAALLVASGVCLTQTSTVEAGQVETESCGGAGPFVAGFILLFVGLLVADALLLVGMMFATGARRRFAKQGRVAEARMSEYRAALLRGDLSQSDLERLRALWEAWPQARNPGVVAAVAQATCRAFFLLAALGILVGAVIGVGGLASYQGSSVRVPLMFAGVVGSALGLLGFWLFLCFRGRDFLWVQLPSIDELRSQMEREELRLLAEISAGRSRSGASGALAPFPSFRRIA